MGCDVMKKTHCKLDLKNSVVSFYDDLIVLPLQYKDENAMILRNIHPCVVPPNAEALVPLRLPCSTLWAYWSREPIRRPH